MKITRIDAFEIIDNRAMPTVRAGVRVDDDHWGWADVPCGSSTGSFEARELRDGERRYRGMGVRGAIENIKKKIAPVLCGMSAVDQRALDGAMLDLDGSVDKS
ncbi:MAG: enolase, partial [Desulfobacterales bacterium]|nr:enolase [Desulfobacterales bacterium]